jgi:hypothetical protein
MDAFHDIVALQAAPLVVLSVLLSVQAAVVFVVHGLRSYPFLGHRSRLSYVIFLYLTLRMDDGWGVLTTHTIRYG